LDDKAKRRLSLKRKTNHELFALYYDHLQIKLTPGQFEQYKLVLDKFWQFLGEFPPSAELAAQFLTRYVHHAQATRVRYTGMIRGFMEWYGEDLDIRPRKPKKLPQYVEPADVERLMEVIREKKTNKRTVARDLMLIKFASMTGLRREELADLVVRDVHIKQKMVIVLNAKGEKDRTVPLASSLLDELSEFITGMKPNDHVFGLAKTSITDKVYTWSKKADVSLHIHSLRHYFAEQLLERGISLTVVSALLGHKDLQTTAVYLGLRPGSLQDAVDKLDKPIDSMESKPSDSTNKENSDFNSLAASVEQLSKSFTKMAKAEEKKAKAEEKKARDEDPGRGISPVVY